MGRTAARRGANAEAPMRHSKSTASICKKIRYFCRISREGFGARGSHRDEAAARHTGTSVDKLP